jgi:hypothetical protein
MKISETTYSRTNLKIYKEIEYRALSIEKVIYQPTEGGQELAHRGINTRKKSYIACYGELSIAQNSHDILVLRAIRDYFNDKGIH